MDIYYVDGQFVPADQAVIPVNDLAVLRGLGAFELLRTYSGRPFALDEHLNRLAKSAQKIGLPLPGDIVRIRKIVLDTLARNRNHNEVNIRIIVTGGSSSDFTTHRGQPRLLVLVSEMPRQPSDWYTDGVKITTMKSRRVLPGAKSINYLSATIALKKARAKGAVESAYVDRDGLVYECTTSNIFAFMGARLVTPGRRILAGITRGVILQMAATMFPIEVRDLPFQELTAAEEIFITGTNKGIVPVVRVDDVVIADGRPGLRTRRLMEALETHTRDHVRQSQA
ncbi:MAG: aminotransferase class IV [Desulfosarcina sp.]|nr:aminotransferase class IV [Desulfobacterales bacterium]